MKPGFTLLEVLIAISISALILVGALSMTGSYLQKLAWDRMFSNLESTFFRANASALAGIGQADQYSLYLEREGESSKMWYFEAQESEVSGKKNQTVMAQKSVEVEEGNIVLDTIELSRKEGNTPKTFQANQVLMSFRRPFAFLQFHLLSEKIPKTGSDLQSIFNLPPAGASCEKFTESCVLTLTFVRSGTTQKKSIQFDVQKGITKLTPDP